MKVAQEGRADAAWPIHAPTPLVTDSFVMGVASILDLLDGQSQLLTADEAVTNALYDFLEALIAAEQQMTLYPFLEPESEMALLLDSLEQQLRTTP